MPVLGSRGGGSARGFGRFGGRRPPTAYQLAATFNNTGTYTVGANAQRVAAFIISGGGGGAGGAGGTDSFPSGGGGGGGASGYLVAFSEYPVEPGQTFTITVGSGGNGGDAGGEGGYGTAGNPGGASSFGNLVTVNGGSGGSAMTANVGTGSGGAAGNYNTNISAYINATANANTVGGDGAQGLNSATAWPPATVNDGNRTNTAHAYNGKAGKNGGLLVNMNLLGTVTSSGINTGSGGGGGGGGYTNYSISSYGGSGGAGGTGAGGGGAGGTSSNNQAYIGGQGDPGSGVGAGGGGGGGGVRRNSPATAGRIGGVGVKGQVIIYEAV